MAQTAPTTTSAFAGFIKPAQAQNYFEKARYASSVMQLARQVPLGASGQEIIVPTGKATAGWVTEGQKKPTTETSIGVKGFTPHKIAAISVVSAEVVRANPGNYMTLLQDEIAQSFAEAFDAAALHGDGPFAASVSDTTKSVSLATGAYDGVVEALDVLAKDGKKLNGFAFDRVVEATFLGEKDGVDRPLFVDTPLENTASAVTPGRIIGRSSFLGDGVAKDDVVGFAGDWSQLVWGTVGGIKFDVSTQATVTLDGSLVSLFENNLVAIRAEAEYGLLINDVEAFVSITGTSGS
jgi:HK97 family phage major capsid protein